MQFIRKNLLSNTRLILLSATALCLAAVAIWVIQKKLSNSTPIVFWSTAKAMQQRPSVPRIDTPQLTEKEIKEAEEELQSIEEGTEQYKSDNNINYSLDIDSNTITLKNYGKDSYLRVYSPLRLLIIKTIQENRQLHSSKRVSVRLFLPDSKDPSLEDLRWVQYLFNNIKIAKLELYMRSSYTAAYLYQLARLLSQHNINPIIYGAKLPFLDALERVTCTLNVDSKQDDLSTFLLHYRVTRVIASEYCQQYKEAVQILKHVSMSSSISSVVLSLSSPGYDEVIDVLKQLIQNKDMCYAALCIRRYTWSWGLKSDPIILKLDTQYTITPILFFKADIVVNVKIGSRTLSLEDYLQRNRTAFLTKYNKVVRIINKTPEGSKSKDEQEYRKACRLIECGRTHWTLKNINALLKLSSHIHNILEACKWETECSKWVKEKTPALHETQQSLQGLILRTILCGAYIPLNEGKPASISSLPVEILMQILQYVSPSDIKIQH